MEKKEKKTKTDAVEKTTKVKKVKKVKKIKTVKSVSFKPETVDYSKVRHETSVDQSDRHVPYNLRQMTVEM